eukprot:CAMPEP_0115856880 /NCGR_PEP_ID=MMETSP0287-20121206/15285_1 /TAXON_ID=412157 /ORGANISM="Chrysochromulina rotalis, Strain UIO044" /LENGTH=201 /DNA_ID=CAMNT_0003311077 /DNA_START=172 /DNA_END=777 /DNA_ORIENTATION=+
MTFLIFTPIGWMKVVWALWNFTFGLMILALQFGKFLKTLDKYAGFLSTRMGRSLFYLYCGNCGGASAAYEDAPWHLVLLSYATFLALWYVGLLEACGPRRPSSMDVKELPGEVPTVAPLGLRAASSNPGGVPSAGAAPGSITVSITPDQARSAANFASKNQGAASVAWQAAVSGAGAGSSSVATSSTNATDSRSGNPFFGS